MVRGLVGAYAEGGGVGDDVGFAGGHGSPFDDFRAGAFQYHDVVLEVLGAGLWRVGAGEDVRDEQSALVLEDDVCGLHG